MRKRLAAAVAAAGVTVAGVAVAAPAQADVPCTVTNFSPRSVTVGLTPITRTFGISTSGCATASDWIAYDAGYDFITEKSSAQVMFNPNDFWNSDAGPKDMVVEATNSDFSSNQKRVFTDGFSLLRRTAWQDGTFNASPEPVKKGQTITIKGRLLIVDWYKMKYVPYAGRNVGVQFRTLTGAYQTVKAAKTDANGWLSTTVTAGATGVWRVYYGGNSYAAGSVAIGDAVQVNP